MDQIAPGLGLRAQREQRFYDGWVRERAGQRKMIDRFSAAYYDKGRFGVWGELWRNCDLREKKVLDYCCGDGSFSRLLQNAGAQVTGIDISPELIKLAQSTAAPGGSSRFLVGDAHALPLEEAGFDYVFGNGCLHHLDLPRAYSEIARVLKPGGRAFFMEPLFHHPALWLLRRATPGQRSPDERPLSWRDLVAAESYFAQVRHQEHYLLAVAAAPVHLLGLNVARRVIQAIDAADRRLMAACAPLRHLAWLTLIELKKEEGHEDSLSHAVCALRSAPQVGQPAAAAGGPACGEASVPGGGEGRRGEDSGADVLSRKSGGGAAP